MEKTYNFHGFPGIDDLSWLLANVSLRCFWANAKPLTKDQMKKIPQVGEYIFFKELYEYSKHSAVGPWVFPKLVISYFKLKKEK